MSASGDERQKRTPALELLSAWEKALAAGASQDALNEILNVALDASAVELADRLREEAPRMLREEAEVREGFEGRLQKRWMRALDLYEMVFVACRKAGSDLHDVLRQEDGPVSQHPSKLRALTLQHVRGCLVASEVYALLRTGHAAGAQARWRTLHEIAVIAFILGANGEELAERFLLHRQVERWKEAECYQENCGALGRERFTDEEMDEFRAGYDAVVARYEEGYARDWGWSKPAFQSRQHRPNFDDLEKLAGLGHNKPFVKLSHHAIHSGSSGALDVLELHGRGQVMLAGPSDAGLAEPGHGSLIALYQVTVAYLLHGPSDTDPDAIRSAKAIALLLEEAGAAFGACEAQFTEDGQA